MKGRNDKKHHFLDNGKSEHYKASDQPAQKRINNIKRALSKKSNESACHSLSSLLVFQSQHEF